MNQEEKKYPDDAEYRFCGIDYKVGCHGLVYKFVLGEWIRANMTVDEIEKLCTKKGGGVKLSEIKT